MHFPRSLLLMPLLCWASYTFAATNPYLLAAKHGCLGCHAPDFERAGPSFQQIAERHAKQPDALEALVRSSREGSVKRWGETPMPPDLAPEPEVRLIVRWILEQ